MNSSIEQQTSIGHRVLGGSHAVASGAEFAEGPVGYDGILLAGFGGPEGQEDVIPFLRNVTRGKNIPENRLEEVAKHYRHFGGVSPINEQNRQLKRALEAELAARSIDLPVFWGNRNWNPYLDEALMQAYESGCRTLIAISTSAYSCYSSCRQYREDFAAATQKAGLAGKLVIDKVRLFFDHPGFVQPFFEGIEQSLAQLRAQRISPARIKMLFSTHSIPEADAILSGPAEGDFSGQGAYVAQHQAVARVIMRQLQQVEPELAAWQLVYQSRSGDPRVPWLEPDINDAIRELTGFDAVIIVPLGFVSDHMEVLWDLDNEALQTARDCGLAAVRSATPGVHSAYVAGLIDLVMERVQGKPPLERPALTKLGPWYDVCRPGCCENKRAGFKAAYAGLVP